MGMVKIYAEIPKNSPKCEALSILQGTFGDPALRALRHWVQLWIGLKMIFFQHFNFNGNLWELYMSRKTIYMYIFWTEARDGEAISRHPIKIGKGNSEIPRQVARRTNPATQRAFKERLGLQAHHPVAKPWEDLLICPPNLVLMSWDGQNPGQWIQSI